MVLAPGTRIGAYEVLSALGAGGMGEVYRARDTKLDRDVALKILPESFASDPDRLMRFEREAKTLASLNHPNIAAIYGFEERALVMELVEGEDLSQRIGRGPIPIDEALSMAKQIAEALAAAHEQGIIHRDLKPANVKVRPDGAVKVLDFGLAKAMDQGSGIGEQGSGHAANSPTITSPAMTMHGVILGTAAYMSPEQARGAIVDKRSDIWAFGVVVFEMLAGRRVFEGATMSDTLASVLKTEPDWTALPPDTPATIRTLLRRCLEKDRKQRLSDASDARLEIADAQLPSLAENASTLTMRSARVPWMVAAAIGLALIAAGVPAVRHLTEQAPVAEPIEFTFSAPENVTLAGQVPAMSVSPDGRHVAFVGSTQGTYGLWVRSLASASARLLPGTEGAPSIPPIWSPDSRSLAFGQGRLLKRVPITGGPPVTIAEVGVAAFNGSWSPDGVILFDAASWVNPASSGGLLRVLAAGGTPTVATTVDRARGETRHLFPVFLPDGRHFLYVALRPPAVPELKLGSLDSADSSIVMAVDSQVAFSANQLLFWHEGSLMAQGFDPVARQLAGEATPAAAGVAMNRAQHFGAFGASVGGVLAYSEGIRDRVAQLSWFDRAGSRLSTVGEPGDWRGLALSPDERRVAVTRFDESANSSVDLWTIDLERSVSSRLTFDASVSMNNSPVWSPDGRLVAFQQARPRVDGDANTGAGVYQKASNGRADAELLMNGVFQFGDWSADGRYLVAARGREGSQDLWVMPLTGDRKPFALMTTRFEEREPAFSPDVRWIAYISDESGQMQVFVEPFPATGGKFQVSRTGGRYPTWRRDGKELFFLAPDGTLMATPITGQGGFEAGIPQALFSAGLVNMPPGQRKFAVSADGKRFLVNVVQRTGNPRQITVVVNWPASLQK